MCYLLIKWIIDAKWSRLEREVGNELIQQQALGTPEGRACAKGCNQGCRDLCCSCKSVRASDMLTWCTIITTLIIVILVGVTLVGPHIQSASYRETQCHVVNIQHDEEVDCICGLSCESRTTCVKVNVNYTRQDGETVQGLLYIVDGDLKCTAAPCSESLLDNQQSAAAFVRDYIPPRSFKCLYDPAKGSTEVIKHRDGAGLYVHILLWPLVVLVLAIAAAILKCRICGCVYAWSESPPWDVKVIAANLHMAGIYTLKSLPVEERRRLVRECTPAPEELEPQIQRIQRGEIPQPV